MSKNTLKIIFVILIAVCLYSLYISGLEVNAAYDRIDELETENAIIKNDNDVLRSKIEILELELEEARNLEDVLSEATYIGDFEVTYYTAGYESTGKTPSHSEYGITKSGEPVKENYTAATDWSILPKGTIFYIEGVGVRVSKDGGYDIKGERVDVFEPELETALKNGRHMASIYVIEWGEG